MKFGILNLAILMMLSGFVAETAFAGEKELARIEKKVDQTIANQEKILKKMSELSEEIHKIKIRVSK